MIIERTESVYTAFQQGPLRPIIVEAESRERAVQEVLEALRVQKNEAYKR